jgi:Glycogen recognition site of AMP-activated protein kinase/Domain of unknown function (DUF3471)
MNVLLILALCINICASSFILHPSSFSPTPSSFSLPPSSFQARQPNPEALKKYTGRYELEVGLIPISTLDVTLGNDTLWVKPSLLKKRKLIHKSKTVFVDEIDGRRFTFAKNGEGEVVSVSFEYEGGDYVAQKVALPSPSLKGNTVFRLKGYPDATIVILTGSFNNWNQSQFVFGREGEEWVCRIDLDPGTYTYKFIVDGNWLLDPSNSTTEEDAAGNVNSVLVKQN